MKCLKNSYLYFRLDVFYTNKVNGDLRGFNRHIMLGVEWIFQRDLLLDNWGSFFLFLEWNLRIGKRKASAKREKINIIDTFCGTETHTNKVFGLSMTRILPTSVCVCVCLVVVHTICHSNIDSQDNIN